MPFREWNIKKYMLISYFQIYPGWGISWKIMKILKTEKGSKIFKINNFFTCLLLFRILVNLQNFEMLSHLNELDLCGLFKTEDWSRSGCHSFFFFIRTSLFRRESIFKLPCLTWWPQTKGKNVHRLTPWQFWNALTPKWVGLVQTLQALVSLLLYTTLTPRTRRAYCCDYVSQVLQKVQKGL